MCDTGLENGKYRLCRAALLSGLQLLITPYIDVPVDLDNMNVFQRITPATCVSLGRFDSYHRKRVTKKEGPQNNPTPYKLR